MIAELSRDRRRAADVGRVARLELVFERRKGRTVLAHAYAEPPFRVGRCFPEEDGLHMIMAASAPGIFGGDAFEQVIRVESGARVRLTSQSALQVHPSSNGAEADIRSTYRIEADASLHCQWDPMIPFAGARFAQRIDIRLAPTAQLYWSDAFMAGRAFADRRSVGFGDAGAGTGERWAFGSLGHELRLARDETLEYLERYRIVPSERKVLDPWVAGEACYFGTTIRSGGATSVSDAERLQAELMNAPGVRAATDAVSAALWVTRIMGNSGVPFHEARRIAKSHMSAHNVR